MIERNPVFNNVKDFGVVGDGITDNSDAINKAIDFCKKNNGGTLYFPSGIYYTKPIELIDNLTLYLETGTELKFSNDFNDYSPVFTRWEGVECYALHPCIFGKDIKNFNITGHGTINGQGEAWWNEYKSKRKENRLSPESEIEKKLALLNPEFEESGSGGGGREMQFLRPPLIQLVNCKSITLDGFTAQNSPFWNIHLVYCNDAAINNVKFINPKDAPNTDGLDVDSSCNIRISNCLFDVGDDCLCLKSGMDADGRRVGKPTENVTITNCTMLNGHGGIVLGSDIAGGIRNVTVSNCIFIGTDRGIRIKSRRGRGGIVEDIHFNNIVMRSVISPFVINMFYECGAGDDEQELFSKKKLSITDATPEVKNISIANITAREVKGAAGFFYGLPEMPIKNLRLDNVVVEMNDDHSDDGAVAAMVRNISFKNKTGIVCGYLDNAVFNNVKVSSQRGEEIFFEESKNITVK